MVKTSIKSVTCVLPLPLTPLNHTEPTAKKMSAVETMCNVGIQSEIKFVSLLFNANPMSCCENPIFITIISNAATRANHEIRFKTGKTESLSPSPINRETIVLVAELKPQNGTI